MSLCNIIVMETNLCIIDYSCLRRYFSSYGENIFLTGEKIFCGMQYSISVADPGVVDHLKIST
jgi:hypothetical protein